MIFSGRVHTYIQNKKKTNRWPQKRRGGVLDLGLGGDFGKGPGRSRKAKPLGITAAGCTGEGAFTAGCSGGAGAAAAPAAGVMGIAARTPIGVTPAIFARGCPGSLI